MLLPARYCMHSLAHTSLLPLRYHAAFALGTLYAWLFWNFNPAIVIRSCELATLMYYSSSLACCHYAGLRMLLSVFIKVEFVHHADVLVDCVPLVRLSRGTFPCSAAFER
jgi:hypothetical protein